MSSVLARSIPRVVRDQADPFAPERGRQIGEEHLDAGSNGFGRIEGLLDFSNGTDGEQNAARDQPFHR